MAKHHSRQISAAMASLSSSAASMSTSSTNQSSSPSSTAVLFPQLASSIAPLEHDDRYTEIIKIEKDLVPKLRTISDPLEDVGDVAILPDELLAGPKKISKVAPLRRLAIEEVEDEEEPEDEEDEEEEVVEDEEDDAGGDYLVTHFDNGEGYEDNDEEGDDMTSMI